MTKLTLAILMVVLTTHPGRSQAISKQTAAIVNALAEMNRVDCSHIGYVGSPSEQFGRFEKLCQTATDQELRLLTDHSNNTVKSYAFQALSLRNNIDAFPILLKHVTDTSTIETFCGCIISSQYVGDYFIDVAAADLTSQQQKILDSVLIFQNGIVLTSKDQLLRRIKPSQLLYYRIRELAAEKNVVAALALAKYKNQNDIEIIKSFFESEQTEYYAAYAVREFPHEAFYPSLVKLFEKEWANKLYDYSLWRILYQAIARYPLPKTYWLFERTVNTKDNFRNQTLGVYLTIAITKYPEKIFDPLKSKIKLDEYHQREVEQEMNAEN